MIYAFEIPDPVGWFALGVISVFAVLAIMTYISKDSGS